MKDTTIYLLFIAIILVITILIGIIIKLQKQFNRLNHLRRQIEISSIATV